MSEYFTLKVKEVVRETDQSVTLHFKQPLFRKIKYKSGQFLTLILPIGGQKLRRSYSLCTAPNLDGTLGVTVKRIPNGVVSNYINDHIKAGDSLEIMEPMGHFTLEPDKNQKRHIVLFGAGSGITPLMSILKSVLFFEPDSLVSLVFGNRNEQSIIFKDQLEQLKSKFTDRLQVVHVLSQPASSWGGYSGRIDRVQAVNVLNLLPKMEAEQTEYFLCGPEGMIEEVKEGLKKLKVKTEKIHTESFFHQKEENAAPAAGGYQQQTVTIILDGQEHKVSVPPSKSILEAALDEGLDMPFSCQSGLCTACMGLCKSGKVDIVEGDGLSADELAKGYVLTCVGHPRTSDVVIEIE